MSIRENRISRTIKIMMNLSALIFLVTMIILIVSFYTENNQINETHTNSELLSYITGRFADTFHLLMYYEIAINIIRRVESDASMTFNESRYDFYINEMNINMKGIKEYLNNISMSDGYYIVKDKTERALIQIYEFTSANDSVQNYTRILPFEAVIQNIINRIGDVYQILMEHRINKTLDSGDWRYVNEQFLFIEANYFNSIRNRLEFACSFTNNEIILLFSDDKSVMM